MSAFITRMSELMSPRAPTLNQNEDTSVAGVNNPNGTTFFQDGNDASPRGGDAQQQQRDPNIQTRRVTIPDAQDDPKMGVVQMSREGQMGIFMGGKPLYDWSGLDPTDISAMTPNKFRGEYHKSQKSFYYRVKGLDTKITAKDDLRETCRNIFDHLVTHGMDTISYLPDPANPTKMESVVEKPNMFSKAYVVSELPYYTLLWDSYDKENDECATKFFLASLSEEMLRKVRDALATTTKPTFLLTWMTFVEKIRVISVGRVDGLQKLVEARTPFQYPGQNLETMAADNIRDINDLEQAGWYNLSTGNTMVRNFTSANSECPSFAWFAQAFLAKYEDHVTMCFHMNKNDCKQYMKDQGFDYETICTTFADYYRKANQDGRWLPSKTPRDSRSAPRHFANQAKLQQHAPSVDRSKTTGVCHNCNKPGHWARNCPSSAATARTSNRGPSTGTSSKRNGTTGSTPWTKVPPANGASESKSMHGKTFYWCAKCKRWTTSHKTSEHKSKESNDTVTTSTSNNNISLMAHTNFSAWHVNITTQRTDVLEEKNYWLTMINNFITNFIFLPLQFLLLLGIGIIALVLTCVGVLSVTTYLGYATITPIIWISSLILFSHLQPIFSYVAPSEPPPPLLRWQKRKIEKWIRDAVKRERKMKATEPGIDTFHRSYPLNLRSDGIYRERSELYMRRDALQLRAAMIKNTQILEDEMKATYLQNQTLIAKNKLLTSERDSLLLYNPTPFERETESPEQKEKRMQTALDDIQRRVDTVRTGVNGFYPELRHISYIAACVLHPQRTFLNIVQTTLSSWLNSDRIDTTETPKTVIWDSGSSMSITNDRSEFIVDEYEALPSTQTITGISNSKVKIQGVGMVRWSFEDTKGHIRTLELPCLHVPSCPQRLLSTTSLMEQYPEEEVKISTGKFVLSGGKLTNSIEAYIDTNNKLPTSMLVDTSAIDSSKTAMNACITVVSEANQNLTEAEKELLKWHYRLAHIDCNKVKFLFRTGVLAKGEGARSLQTTAAKIKTNPRCAACQYGKQCQLSVPTTTGSKVTDSVGAISKDIIRPGQQVCIDHFICKNKGRLFTSRGKTVPTDMYGGGCIFVDNYSGFVHVELQKHMNTLETLQAKERFESMALDFGVIPQTYLSDNGAAFTSHEFSAKMKQFDQVSKFSGAGAHHHNGVAERNIRTIISIARTMMMHSATHWMEQSDVELWPMAVKHAVHVFNRVPSIETGICPLDAFTRQRFQQSKLHDLHVWGCPVYVLDKKIADGIKIQKWAPRSDRYVYMGTSDRHSSTVPLVLNPNTGVISPQFHVVVDEWFATIAQSSGVMPDFTDEKWTKMFGENQLHYLTDNDDEQNDDTYIPPPQLESVERRETRVGAAIARERPPIPLPMVDPPSATLPTTKFHTPNRFEPLSSFDDENLEPHLTINTNTPVIHTESPIQREPVPASPIQTETVSETVMVPQTQTINVPPPPIVQSPTLRRSTRDRRPPDRLNLYTESNSCFFIEQEPFGIGSVGEDAFTYLLSALCDTTPNVFQASMLISADSFKASTGDPDTLSWDQAMGDVTHLEKWMGAALQEISSLEKHGTWEVDDIANAKTKILPGTWVFRIKRAPDGSIQKYKARYCVRGDLQVEQNETYAPVVGWSTIRLFLILSILLHWETRAIDFSQAFVQAFLKTPVWIHLPRGFHTGKETKKCLKLVKSLYGLAEAPRLWYLHLFDALVNKLGFTQSKIDPCLLMKRGMMIVVFVDDCAISFQNEKDYSKLISDLRNNGFELTEEGEFSKFLGISFERKNNTIHMTQTGLIERIAEATGLTNSNPNHTPTNQDALGKDKDGPDMTDSWSYRSIVGMLLYLSTNTRPDIAYSVSQVARFSNNPKQSHATAIKTIVRYLIGTKDKGTLVTPTGKLDIQLYVDADFAGLFKREHESDPDSARSRTGYILLLGGFPLIWKSQLQTKIALSTLEAEYSALSAATRALIPIRELLFEVSHTVALPHTLVTTIRSTIFEDNQGAYLLASTQQISARTRYFTVEYHHFWEYVKMEDENKRKIFLEKVATEKQGADFLTKGLVKFIFRNNRLIILGW